MDFNDYEGGGGGYGMGGVSIPRTSPKVIPDISIENGLVHIFGLIGTYILSVPLAKSISKGVQKYEGKYYLAYTIDKSPTICLIGEPMDLEKALLLVKSGIITDMYIRNLNKDIYGVDPIRGKIHYGIYTEKKSDALLLAEAISPGYQRRDDKEGYLSHYNISIYKPLSNIHIWFAVE